MTHIPEGSRVATDAEAEAAEALSEQILALFGGKHSSIIFVAMSMAICEMLQNQPVRDIDKARILVDDIKSNVLNVLSKNGWS